MKVGIKSTTLGFENVVNFNGSMNKNFIGMHYFRRAKHSKKPVINHQKPSPRITDFYNANKQ
jgi:hypothetical protein